MAVSWFGVSGRLPLYSSSVAAFFLSFCNVVLPFSSTRTAWIFRERVADGGVCGRGRAVDPILRRQRWECYGFPSESRNRGGAPGHSGQAIEWRCDRGVSFPYVHIRPMFLLVSNSTGKSQV